MTCHFDSFGVFVLIRVLCYEIASSCNVDYPLFVAVCVFLLVVLLVTSDVSLYFFNCALCRFCPCPGE